MQKLKGFQRKYLRGLAHSLKPVVQIGQKGLTDAAIQSIDEALDHHELIKIKFGDFKEKELKQEMTAEIEERTGSESAGMIGHTIILYRRQPDDEKRRIRLPERDESAVEADSPAFDQ